MMKGVFRADIRYWNRQNANAKSCAVLHRSTRFLGCFYRKYAGHWNIRRDSKVSNEYFTKVTNAVRYNHIHLSAEWNHRVISHRGFKSIRFYWAQRGVGLSTSRLICRVWICISLTRRGLNRSAFIDNGSAAAAAEHGRLRLQSRILLQVFVASCRFFALRQSLFC